MRPSHTPTVRFLPLTPVTAAPRTQSRVCTVHLKVWAFLNLWHIAQSASVIFSKFCIFNQINCLLILKCECCFCWRPKATFWSLKSESPSPRQFQYLDEMICNAWNIWRSGCHGNLCYFTPLAENRSCIICGHLFSVFPALDWTLYSSKFVRSVFVVTPQLMFLYRVTSHRAGNTCWPLTDLLRAARQVNIW